MFTAGVAAQGSEHDRDISFGYLEEGFVDSEYESTEISFIEPAGTGAEAPELPICQEALDAVDRPRRGMRF